MPALTEERPGPPERSGRAPAVIHPFLFALSPILFLYVHNSRQFEVSPGELLLPLVAVLGGVAAVFLLSGLVLRNWNKAGLVAALAVVLGLSWGHVYQAAKLEVIGPGYLLILWFLLLVLGIVLVVRTRRNLNTLTTVLNVLAGAAVATNLALGLPVLMQARPGNRTSRTAPPRAVDTAGLPDIYYIILDAYARADVMKAVHGYDNADFRDFLRQNGFYVADRARANYAQTYLSLASSLNFTYLDSLAHVLGTQSKDRKPLMEMIGRSRVAEYLRERGYRTVGLASGHTGTDLADADYLIEPRGALSEFQNILLNTTVLPPLLALLKQPTQLDRHRARVRFVLDQLPKAAVGRHPAFVFTHIVCPHMPFVFGANGEAIRPAQTFRMDDQDMATPDAGGGNRELYRRYYGPQARYVSKLARTAIEGILAQSTESPVIIVQGDHGTRALAGPTDTGPEQLTERLAILNAIRLPPGPDSAIQDAALYDSLSPINSFRVVFNRLFGAGLPLEPDRSYYSSACPYRFLDIDSLGAPRMLTARESVPGR